MKHILLLGSLISIISCSTNKKSAVNDKNVFLKVTTKNDTLSYDIEKGEIVFFRNKNDTLKIGNEDERSIHVVLALLAEDKNNIISEANDKFETEMNFKFTGVQDTIKIPFSVKPHFKGKGTILGIIGDTYMLNSYYKDKVRILSTDYNFEKEVYIK